MARRRRQNIPPALLGTLIVLGAVGWLFNNIGELWQQITPGGEALIGLIILAPVAIFIVKRIKRHIEEQDRLREAEEDRESMLRKAASTTDGHLRALLKRRVQLIRHDAYGKPQTDEWLKELKYFISSQVAPTLNEGEQRALLWGHDALLLTIAERIEEAATKTSAFVNFSSRMTPSEFEAYCAEELRRVGWQAYVTRGGRDQGIDVVATKSGIKLILQCKLYTAPVGNKAVQEVFAGKAFEGAQYAAVVSNSPYTPSAQQLAATNGVLLLHYSDLARIETRLVH